MSRRLSFVLFLLLLSACSPRAWQPLDTDYDQLNRARAAIGRAHAVAAELCAPDAMSDAQTAFYHAAHELSEGRIHLDETSGLIAMAEKRAEDAYNKSMRRCLLTTVRFAFDSDVLTPGAQSRLRAILGLLSGKARYLQLDGHADSRGSEAYNISLSRRRASAVRRYLAAHGVRPRQMEIRAYGESRPVASNETEAGRAKNRRVEVWRLGRQR